MPTVVITQDRNRIESAIGAALERIAVEDLVRGKIVAIKPNETWASAEDTSGVTQPDTLRAVLQYVKAYHPRQLIVTGGSGAAETDEVFRISGMMDVAKQEGAEFFDHNRPPFVSVELDYNPDRDVKGPQKSVMVNPRILQYETLIALNQLKVHRTATVTLSLKNIAMSFPAADYYGHPRSTKKHDNCFFDDMQSFIAAMAKRFPISLAITVGHPAMVGTGPLGGKPVETGLVIASTDALAADAVGAYLLGFHAEAVAHLKEAANLGIGESDPDRCEFPVLSADEAFERFTEAVYGRALSLHTA